MHVFAKLLLPNNLDRCREANFENYFTYPVYATLFAMFLFRRFMAVFMKRIAAFCHEQQLTVPILFFAVFELWQLATRRLTWESFQKNPWNEFMPYVVTVGVLLIPQILLAARDLNRELLQESRNDPPKIIHSSNQVTEPSKLPARLIAVTLISFVIFAEALMVERAYPEETMIVAATSPPKPPAFALNRSVVDQPTPAKVHVTRYVTLPYELGRTLRVRMFVDNLGGVPITVKGGTYAKSVDQIPSDYTERRKAEQSIWKEMSSLSVPVDLVSVIPVLPPGQFFIELESGIEMTQEIIEKLSKGTTVYLLTVYRDANRRVRLDSCIRTIPSRDSVLYCLDTERNVDDVNVSKGRPKATKP
jgi:hypothetical protein